jgi:hypothetical protein
MWVFLGVFRQYFNCPCLRLSVVHVLNHRVTRFDCGHLWRGYALVGGPRTAVTHCQECPCPFGGSVGPWGLRRVLPTSPR